LRRAEAAAQARSALFQKLAARLERMIDAGDLQITLRSGRMVLVLPNDVLFDSGKAEIKARGREALGQVAAALASFEGRRYQVAGHTDNVPIRHSGFASNWQLSAERALEVVRFMIQAGMKPDALSAAEITLQPNIDEFVALPAAEGG
jgi:chemotaxis protein MotB